MTETELQTKYLKTKLEHPRKKEVIGHFLGHAVYSVQKSNFYTYGKIWYFNNDCCLLWMTALEKNKITSYAYKLYAFTSSCTVWLNFLYI